MSRIILIAIILAGVVFWWQWNNTDSPEHRKRLLQRSGISVLIVAILLLVLTGHMHWLGAVLAGLLAFVRQNLSLLVRYSPLIAQLFRSRASASNSYTVNTRFIQMKLDHTTGKLTGSVLAGEFMGRSLDDMNNNELDQLLHLCRNNDLDSARLLDSYITTRFGAHSRGYSSSASRTESGMSAEEALQVLGLSGSPTKDEITQAYRKIMQQLHPDRGGNEYFAAKANQARDVLNKRFA